MLGEEEKATGCTKEGLDWMLRNVLSLKGVSSVGTGCQGHGGVSLPGRMQKARGCGVFGTWFSGALGNVSLTAGLDAFGGLFLP